MPWTMVWTNISSNNSMLFFGSMTDRSETATNFQDEWDFETMRPVGFDEDARYWRGEHEARVSEWERKTGTPTEARRGLLSKYDDVMRNHFGLGTHVSHINLDRAKDGGWKDETNVRSTLAHITLPACPKMRQNFTRRIQRYDPVEAEMASFRGSIREAPYLDTENFVSLPTEVPTQLSAESVARFTRALKILDVTPREEIPRPKFFASKNDMGAFKTTKSNHAEETAAQNPQLIFLLRVNDRPIFDE